MKAIYKYDELGELVHLRDLPEWATDEEIATMVEIYQWQNPEAKGIFAYDFEAENRRAVQRQMWEENGGFNLGELEEAYGDYIADCEDEDIEPMPFEKWIDKYTAEFWGEEWHEEEDEEDEEEAMKRLFKPEFYYW